MFVKFIGKIKQWYDEHEMFGTFLFVITVVFVMVMVLYLTIGQVDAKHKCHFCGVYFDKYHGEQIEYDGRIIWCCNGELNNVREINIEEYNKRINQSTTAQPNDKYKAGR